MRSSLETKSPSQILCELNDMLNATEIVAYRRMCRTCTGAHILSHAKERLLYIYRREANQSKRNALRDAIHIVNWLHDECNDDYYRYMKEYEGCLT